MKQQQPIYTRVLLAFAFAVLSQSALAVPGESSLNTFQQWMNVLGGIIITLAIMYAAIGMMWQKKHFSEVAHVFIGGILFGAATIVGPMLTSGRG
jgi:hypothetical protein